VKFEQFPAEDKGRKWNTLPVPPNRDFDARITKGKWVRVTGHATCGCLWTLDIRQDPNTAGGPNLTFAQCFDLYGAQFTIGVHDHDHLNACLEALPPYASRASVYFDTDMTLGELLEAT
jgi:hypothetical protein